MHLSKIGAGGCSSSICFIVWLIGKFSIRIDLWARGIRPELGSASWYLHSKPNAATANIAISVYWLRLDAYTEFLDIDCTDYIFLFPDVCILLTVLGFGFVFAVHLGEDVKGAKAEFMITMNKLWHGKNMGIKLARTWARYFWDFLWPIFMINFIIGRNCMAELAHVSSWCLVQ